MSENETHVGRMIKLDFPDECITWKDKFIHLQKKGYEFKDYDIDNEWIGGESEGSTISANGDFYQIIKSKDFDYEDIYEASHNEDGTVSYVLKYYNGSCGFQEALEEALNNLTPLNQ